VTVARLQEEPLASVPLATQAFDEGAVTLKLPVSPEAVYGEVVNTIGPPEAVTVTVLLLAHV
jgi:hypothetical protein